MSIPYGEIPHFPTSTAIGHRGELVIGRCAGRAGRGDGRPRPLLRGLHARSRSCSRCACSGRLGVKTLVLTNAAGSVNVNYKPGELMVIEDHINYMGDEPARRARTTSARACASST